MVSAPHLWLALSPHGFGHAAMTAPVVAEMRRRHPAMRLTIQTTLPRDFLESRYGSDFEQVAQIADFGFRMKSSTEIDLEGSAATYAALHGDFDSAVAREQALLEKARPDLVLANVPYVVCEAAGRADIPVVAMSSLNWADMFAHYLAGMPGATRIEAQMRTAYGRAETFLQCTPSQDMTLPNITRIGVLGRRGTNRRAELEERLGTGGRVGLIAFGGIDHPLPMDEWPILPGWRWLHAVLGAPLRKDLYPWQECGLTFSDLMASVDVVITKPGYGTFTELGLCGTSCLYLQRPDWPESANLEAWLKTHCRALEISSRTLFSKSFPEKLQTLLSLPPRHPGQGTGVVEAANVMDQILTERINACERS